jgi:hypothetical protein
MIYFMHMKTVTKILLLVGGVIGVGIAWYLGSPLFITNRVSEALPTPAVAVESPLLSAQVATIPPVVSPSVEAISEGTFTGFDKLHRASGTAHLIRADGKTYIRFEEDFTVTNGPDLFVYLGNENKYDSSANLGRLKGNEGSQNYEIPSSINLDTYSEVWVWCRAFSVPFGKAVLR